MGHSVINCKPPQPGKEGGTEQIRKGKKKVWIPVANHKAGQEDSALRDAVQGGPGLIIVSQDMLAPKIVDLQFPNPNGESSKPPEVGKEKEVPRVGNGIMIMEEPPQENPKLDKQQSEAEIGHEESSKLGQFIINLGQFLEFINRQEEASTVSDDSPLNTDLGRIQVFEHPRQHAPLNS